MTTFRLAVEYIMCSLIPQIAALASDDLGQDMIEYALVAGVLGVGALVAMRNLSTKIGTAFTGIGTTLTTNV